MSSQSKLLVAMPPAPRYLSPPTPRELTAEEAAVVSGQQMGVMVLPPFTPPPVPIPVPF